MQSKFFKEIANSLVIATFVLIFFLGPWGLFRVASILGGNPILFPSSVWFYPIIILVAVGVYFVLIPSSPHWFGLPQFDERWDLIIACFLLGIQLGVALLSFMLSLKRIEGHPPALLPTFVCLVEVGVLVTLGRKQVRRESTKNSYPVSRTGEFFLILSGLVVAIGPVIAVP